MALTFSAERIWARIAPRIEAAINETALMVMQDARRRAPVRKVFKGSVGRAALQSVEEVAAEAVQRSRLGLAPGPVRTQRTPASRVHAFGPRRILLRPAFDPKVSRFRSAIGQFATAGTNRLMFDTPLTARGRYELKTGRANITSGGQAFLGGRLRSEITIAESSGGSAMFAARVISPTPYAKFVEFGTRRSRAQPYLRPAMQGQRASLRERLLGALR